MYKLMAFSLLLFGVKNYLIGLGVLLHINHATEHQHQARPHVTTVDQEKTQTA